MSVAAPQSEQRYVGGTREGAQKGAKRNGFPGPDAGVAGETGLPSTSHLPLCNKIGGGPPAWPGVRHAENEHAEGGGGELAAPWPEWSYPNNSGLCAGGVSAELGPTGAGPCGICAGA